MSLDELRRLLPPPVAPVDVPTAEDWQDAERALGLTLPADYKAFLSTYGSGRIADFFGLFRPGSKERAYNLVSTLDDERDVFAEMQRGGYPVRFELYPARPGLIPLAQTDNGDAIFYLVDGEPGAWRIAVLPSRARDVEVFDGNLTAFLLAALRGEVGALPNDLAQPTANFVPTRSARSSASSR